MRYFLLPFLLLLSACSVTHYELSSSKIFTIKSPHLKFSDLAFIRHSGDNLSIELFVAGKSVKKIDIAYLVCVDEGCMSRSSFNSDFLSSAYPDELLQNVLLGKPIYGGKNRVNRGDGYEQKIYSQDVHILYKVDTKSIYFKDKKNSILIKIKDIQ